MANKAILPTHGMGHARPLTAAERLFWRRFLIGLLVALLVAVLVVASPMLLSGAVAMGVFDGWDMPIEYD